MNQDNKNRVDARQRSAFGKIEQMHPLRMLLYLSMMGIGMLFLILVIAFAQSGGFTAGLKLPKFFSISTILLLFSSYTLSKVTRIYKKDKLRRMAKYLGATLLLGLFFILAQLVGWRELDASGLYFNGKASGTYLYLISALHILHLLGGVIFLSFLFFKTIHMASDSVRTLIYIRDPYRRLQLSMLCSYWHFMDFLWLGLYIVFLTLS